MKEILEQYAAYNQWANKKFIDAFVDLPPTVFDHPVESSFSSLRRTIVHLWETQYIWYQRLLLTKNIISPANSQSDSIASILDEWNEHSIQVFQWVKDSNEEGLATVLPYVNTKGEQFQQPVYQVLLHMFNHVTYHRGQIVSILRQLGLSSIPATDFILWSRIKR